MKKYGWILLYKLHIYYLQIRHLLFVDHSDDNLLRASYHREWRTIFCKKIRGPLSYVIALHEIGHANDPLLNGYENLAIKYSEQSFWSLDLSARQTVREFTLICEYNANSWVVRNTIHLTPEMKRFLLAALQTYEQVRYPLP